MRRFNGFSLMEMMVVLTIIAIIAAVSAPMVSKNMQHGKGGAGGSGLSSGCAWHHPDKDPNSIAFNYANNEEQNKTTASIGKLIYTFSSNKPRLYIHSKSSTNPHIELDSGSSSPITKAKTLKMMYKNDSIWFSTKDFNAKTDSSIVIGNNADSTENLYNISIGENANADCGDGIAMGRNTVASGQQSAVAIGHEAKAKGWVSTAVGAGAEATNYASSAFGSNAKAYENGSTAIGAGAQATEPNQIVLGTSNTTVYIPGNIIIDGNSTISRNPNAWALYKIYSDNVGFNLLRNINTTIDGNGKGELEIGGEYGLDSDRRLKNVGEAFKGGLEEIKKLEVFNYVYKKDSTKTPRVGVIAQDLQKIFPNAVFKGDDGFLRIRMEEMFYALVNAVKELDKRIDLLVEKQKEINDLKTEIKTLKKQYSDLEKRLEKLEKSK